MKDVLVISRSPLHSDPRVYKQILFLREAGSFRVSSAGFTPSGLEDHYYQIESASSVSRKTGRIRKAIELKMRRYDRYYWSDSALQRTYEHFVGSQHRFDLVIANDIPAVPLGQRIAQKHGAMLYVDAHEYEPLRDDSLVFNVFFRDYWFSICAACLPDADYMTTVCRGIAEEYSKRFGVCCDVLLNLPFYEALEPAQRGDGRIRMIHHGNAFKRRRLENMITLMSYLDPRFELDFMLMGMGTPYGRYLRSLASRNPRIRFEPTVAMREIPRKINNYDLGLYLLPPEPFNQKMALPNKIFEYIQARLALAVWPSQEMIRIIDEHKNGVYSADFDVRQIAGILNALSHDDVVTMKANSDSAAKQLNADTMRKQFLQIVESLVGKR